MSSREIVIKLIDEKKITGEEAVVLLNDVIVAELCDAQKVLDQCKAKEPTLTRLGANPWSTTGISVYDPSSCTTSLTASSV